MSEALSVKDRQLLGKLNNRRLRAGGEVPAVLYGHGAENRNLTIASDAIMTSLRQGSKMVDLEGAVNESALISDVHWDTFGRDVLHVDLVRVSKDERIEVSVKLETRGVAPGVSEGGTVEVLLHELEIECPAGSIPDSLEVNINELGLDDTLTAGSIELPAGAKLVTDASATVAQCIEVVEVEDEEAEAGAAATAEPEIIGKPADGEEESSGE